MGAGKDGIFGTGDDATLATTATDASGHYGFTNLLAGKYEVKFTSPAGYKFSAALQGGNTATGSNPNVTTGVIGPITLNAGANDLTIDAGLYQPAALGDYVWLDSNANGIQNSGEN